MTEPFGDPWVNPHHVEVFSEEVPLHSWRCSTCGAEEHGYMKRQYAEQDGDAHASNAHQAAS